MSLEPLSFLTKYRKAIYGLVAVFILFFVCLGLIDTSQSSARVKSADTAEGNMPTPFPLPSPTSIPVASPGPTANPVPTTSPSPIPSASPSATPRNLQLYENAGTITLGTTEAATQAAIAQTRAFILRKWNARQLGRLAFVTMSPINQPFTRNFYIERNTAGVWQITLEIAGSESQEFTFVEEIGVAADGHPILEPWRPGSPQAVTRALHLKASSTVKNGLVL